MSTTETYAPPAAPAEQRQRHTHYRPVRKTIWTVILYVLVALFVIITLLPIYWIVLSAFTPMSELFTVPLNYFPRHPSLINFQTVAQVVPLGQQFINSSLLALLSAFSRSWSACWRPTPSRAFASPAATRFFWAFYSRAICRRLR